MSSENVRVTDSDGDLECFHYTECYDSSCIDLKNTRGVIRRGVDTLCKTFNYTPELFSNDDEGIREVLNSLPSKKVFYKAEEGTILRVWYDFSVEKWRLSSHRKINAFRSRWGCGVSHGEFFKDCILWHIKNGKLTHKFDEYNKNGVDPLELFYSTLNKERIYTFLLRSNIMNRVVCNAPSTPAVYFVGEFDRTDFKLLSCNSSGFDRPEQLFFGCVDDLLFYVKNIDCKESQGVVVYYGEDSLEHGLVKITNSDYQVLSSVRGNCTSVKFRYLQLRNNPELVKKFIDLYPEHKLDFINYESIIYNIASNIYSKYVSRYIKHNYTVMPQEQWFIARSLHELYLSDNSKYKININLVINYINDLPAIRVNYLIRKELERLNGKNVVCNNGECDTMMDDNCDVTEEIPEEIVIDSSDMEC